MSLPSRSTLRNQPAGWASVGTILPKAPPIEDVPVFEAPVQTPEDSEESEESSDVKSDDETGNEAVAPEAVVEVDPNIPEWALDPDFKPKSKLDVSAQFDYWIYMKTRGYNRERVVVPETQSAMSMRAEIHDNEQYVNDNRRLTFIASTTSNGGGSTKTTTADILAAYMSTHIGNGVALMGLDIGADKTVSRFQADEHKILATTMLVKNIDAGVRITPKALVPYTDSDAKSGLVLFKAKYKSDLKNLDYDIEQSSRLLKEMVELYPVLFCDGGPGLNLLTSIGMVLASDIVILPKKGISIESTDDIRSVINHPPYRLKSRMDRIIVTISAVPKHQFNLRTQYAIAEKCGVKPSQVILIPYDRYLDDNVMINLKQVDISSLQLRTRLMYSRLMRLTIDIAKTFN